MTTSKAIDTAQFRQALGSFTTGVTVVTTRDGDKDIGLTANSFNSVSLDPPMVLWSLSKTSFSLSAFSTAKFFAVHVLAEDQQALSGRFASRGMDKFEGLNLARGEGEVPLLDDCAAKFICRTAFQYEGGDHIIFVGEVLDFQRSERPPLLFHDGSYGRLNASAVKQAGTASDAGDFSHDFLGYLLARANQQLFAPVKQELATRKLTMHQYYFINLVGKFDNKTVTQLKDILAMGDYVISDAQLKALHDRNLIEDYQNTEGDEHVRLSDTGQRLFVELASIFKAVEADAEKDLDYDQRQSLKLALRQLIETTDPGPPESWLS